MQTQNSKRVSKPPLRLYTHTHTWYLILVFKRILDPPSHNFDAIVTPQI